MLVYPLPCLHSAEVVDTQHLRRAVEAATYAKRWLQLTELVDLQFVSFANRYFPFEKPFYLYFS